MNVVVIVVVAALSIGAKEPGNVAHGDIVVTTRPFPGSPIPEATVQAVIDAPPELVWSLASDCANYKRTMPSIADSIEVKRERTDDGAEVRVCKVTAALPFPLPNLVSQTRGVHRIVEGKSWSRTWKLVEGDYVRNEGQWLIVPFGDDGKRSLVTYTIEAQPKIAIPDWIVADVETSKLPAMMTNLRAAAAAKLAQTAAPPR